jgi:DDE superfamily endonuclease
LAEVDGRLEAGVARGHAVRDNLATHRAQDVLRWAPAHPRGEFVCQPTSAADLNPIEPRWKVLRSLALKGKRFATWEEVCRAVEQATGSRNAPRHPFVWGRRRRHRPRRRAGIGRMPRVTRTYRMHHLVPSASYGTRQNTVDDAAIMDDPGYAF